MKRFSVLFLAALLMATFAACGMLATGIPLRRMRKMSIVDSIEAAE